ncbi:hypothetical protein ACWD7M_16325 [Streptomyces griseus]
MILTKAFRNAVEQLKAGTDPLTVARRTPDPMLADALREHSGTVPEPELRHVAPGHFDIYHDGRPTQYNVRKIVREKGDAPPWYQASTPWELRLRSGRQASFGSARTAAASLSEFLRVAYLTGKLREVLEEQEALRFQEVGRWPLERQIAELQGMLESARETMEVERSAYEATINELRKRVPVKRPAAPAPVVPRQVKKKPAAAARPAVPVVWSKELHTLEGGFLLDAEKARVLGDAGARAAYEDAAKRLRAARRVAVPAKTTTRKGKRSGAAGAPLN